MFGAQAAGSLAVGMPGAQAAAAEVPPLFRMDVLERLEKAMSGDDPDELGRALGERAGTLKEQLLDAFFAGFDKRETIENRLRDLGRSQQQQQQQQQWGGGGAFSAPQAAAVAAPTLVNPAEQLLVATFCLDRVFVHDARFGAAVKVVAEAAHADLDKIGRGDLKNKALPVAELDPVLASATQLARALRESPMRCLQLVVLARNAGVGTDDDSVRLEATRIYFEQQRRVLLLVCRLLREAAPEGGWDESGVGGGGDEGDDPWQVHYKAALDRLVDAGGGAGGKMELSRRLCTAMKQSFNDFASAYSAAPERSHGDAAQAHLRERRKGREGEMRVACEALQLLLAHPAAGAADVRSVCTLYLELSGYFDKTGPDDLVTFYGNMLACAAAGALVRAGRPLAGARACHEELARMLECASEASLSTDTTPTPARGYLQLVLAVAQLLAADDRWNVSLRHAIANQALVHIDQKLMPCAVLERWSEYSNVLVRSLEGVLQAVSHDMRDKVEEHAQLYESANGERRHETITCLLRSLARAYARLPHESRRVFEGHELELVKRWVVKTLTQEEQRDAVFAVKGAFLELLAALYGALHVRLRSPSSQAEALRDARELMRVVDGLLEQMQVAPAIFGATLREYSDVVGVFLGLPHAEGYIWTPERQQLLGTQFGHSEGHVFLSGQPDQHRQEERERCRAYEFQLVDYLVRWGRFLRAALLTTRLLEDAGAADPSHALSLSSFLRLARDFVRLWARPLPPPVKAELVLHFNALVQSCGGGEERDVLALVWGEFVRGCVMLPVQVLQQVQHQQPLVALGTTPAFMLDFLDIDRTRATYEHTLAYLGLVNTLFERFVPWEDCADVLRACAALVPKTHGGQSGVVFANASQKWMVSAGVFRIFWTVLQTMMESMQAEASDFNMHPGRAVFELVLSWVIRGDGDGLGLRSKVVDVVCLGLQVAEDSEDHAELPHLADAIERALRLLHLAVHVSVTHYGNSELLDALIAERGSRGDRHSLVLTIFRYMALEDEPRLALAALELARLVCQERDSEVYQVLCSEASVSIRERIISSCAAWMQGPHGFDTGDGRSVSAGVLAHVLDSLRRADVEGCVAHYLLGFAPFRIAASDLSSPLPHTALLRFVCGTCLHGEWISDWNDLAARRVQQDEVLEDMEAPPVHARITLAAQLELLRRRQACLEALYHLTRHGHTRGPGMALLCSPGGVGGAVGDADLVREGEGLLHALARSLPEVHTGKAVLEHLRTNIRRLRDGEGIDDPYLLKLWGGGRFELSEGEAERAWDIQISEGRYETGHNDILEGLMTQRWRCEDEEKMLQDALEPHLEFYHQAGWFLRTCAAVIRSASADSGGFVSRDRAKALLRLMFGSADSARGGGGGGGATLSLWSPGRFQQLLDEALDVPEIEGFDVDVQHEALEPSDFDECGRAVDAWSDELMMFDEKLLQDRLYKRMLSKVQSSSREERGELFSLSENFVSRRVLNSYDGYNTVRRCRSARQHLLCGLQDLLEEALHGGLLEDTISTNPSHMHSLLFDLLGNHLLPAHAHTHTLPVPQYAEHVARCIGLAVAAVTRPHKFVLGGPSGAVVGGGGSMALAVVGGGGGAGAHAIDGGTLLEFLNSILALPSRPEAARSMTMRTNLYTAILNLVQCLQREAPSPHTFADNPPPPEELEAVLARHRAALLQVAIKDLAAPDDKPPSWDSRWEGRTVALAIVQVLLPIRRRPSPLSSISSKPPAPSSSRGVTGAGPRLRGIISQYNLLMHLCDDLEGRTALGEVLDITMTESRHAHLLAFKGKMSVLLHLAQDAEGLRELTDGRVLDKLAGCSFLRTHAQGERQIRALLRRARGGSQLGVLARRFHQLLLPSLQLFVALLHDARDPASLRDPAARFVWAHREIFREVMAGGGGGGEDECVEECRLLAEGIAAADGIGAFARDGSNAHAAELDVCVCEWMTLCLSRLLSEGGWQGEGDAGGDVTMGGGEGGGEGGGTGAMERIVENALRFFLRRATHNRQVFFDCSPLLTHAAAPATAPKGLSVDLLVDLLCKCVDSLCGGGEGGGGYAGNSMAMGGVTPTWNKLRDLFTQRDALRGEGGGGTPQEDLVRLWRVERECVTVHAHLQRLRCLCELTLSLIVDSLSVQQSGASPAPALGWGGGRAREGDSHMQMQVGTSVSCVQKLWSRNKTGAAQRLQQFYRDRHVEHSLPCDWPLLQRLINQLLNHLRPSGDPAL